MHNAIRRPSIDADEVISKYLAIPATVSSAGPLGRFDTLRGALEHIQSYGVEATVLTVQAPGQEELQFSKRALTALADRFYDWPSEGRRLGLRGPHHDPL